MWQRFSERARKTVFYAQEEAERFGERYVSTEHMLLGLLRDYDHRAARALVGLGISITELQTEVEKQLPRGESRPNQDMTLTPRAKRVIDLAYDEARRLNNNFIGTEHLLLGLRREADGLAGRALAQMGIELDPLRQMILQVQTEDGIEHGSIDAERTGPTSATETRNWRHNMVMTRVKEWATWAHSIEDEPGSHHEDLAQLRARLEKTMSTMQQSLLLGLCLEVADGGSLETSDNWQKLRLTPEQAKALAEIGEEVRKLLPSE